MSDSESHDSQTLKRKRETEQNDELVIDVDLPEPLSKKATRKSKKNKSTHNHSSNTTNLGLERNDQTSDVEDAQDGNTSSTAAPAGEANAKPRRSSWAVWIGNLPWSATKLDVRQFFTTNAASGINDSQITRVHMPAPKDSAPSSVAASSHGRAKPRNKGFAYVDLDSPTALKEALGLSDTFLGGRRVLIKSAADFNGRPVKEGGGIGVEKMNSDKPASRRIFVGNLGFDVSKDDLSTHFSKCGDILDVHMATFEDSGKCKGFAWVTFEEVKAAESAVRGWFTTTSEEQEDDEEEQMHESDEETEVGPNKRKRRPKSKRGRKIMVDKLYGRPLRCEYAEDPSVRYRKRFGKEGPKDGKTDGLEVSVAEVDPVEQLEESTLPTKSNSHDRRKEKRKVEKNNQYNTRHEPNRDVAANGATNPRNTGPMVKAKGSKITFD